MIQKHKFNDLVIRAVKPRWAHAPTSGDGAAERGGRFNPIGTPALYTSLKFETVGKEVRFEMNQEAYTFYHLAVQCDDIADLTSISERAALEVSFDDLKNENWESEMHKSIVPSTHAIFSKLHHTLGYAGILVNSFAPNASAEDINLVLWKWNTVQSLPNPEPHAVAVLDKTGLPNDNRSWHS